MVDVLVYQDVCQQSGICHALGPYSFRKWSNQERLPVRIFNLEFGAKNELVPDDALDIHFGGLDGNGIRIFHSNLNVIRIILNAFRIDMGLFNGEIGEHGLTNLALMGLDLNKLCILLLHSLHFCIQFSLFFLREGLIKQGRFKNIGIKREILLTHGTEDLLTEPGHHGTEIIDDSLHLIFLRTESFYLTGKAGVLFAKALYFEGQV